MAGDRGASLVRLACANVTTFAPRSETSSDDCPDIRRNRLPVAAGIEHRPSRRCRRLTDVARTHASKQRQVALVFVAIRCLSPRRHMRIDVEQEGDVRLWQVLLDV